MGYRGFATSYWDIILGMLLFFPGKMLHNPGRQDGKRHQDHEDLIAAFSTHIIGQSSI
jgi:hypothetical protein